MQDSPLLLSAQSPAKLATTISSHLSSLCRSDHIQISIDWHFIDVWKRRFLAAFTLRGVKWSFCYWKNNIFYCSTAALCKFAIFLLLEKCFRLSWCKVGNTPAFSNLPKQKIAFFDARWQHTNSIRFLTKLRNNLWFAIEIWNIKTNIINMLSSNYKV